MTFDHTWTDRELRRQKLERERAEKKAEKRKSLAKYPARKGK